MLSGGAVRRHPALIHIVCFRYGLSVHESKQSSTSCSEILHLQLRTASIPFPISGCHIASDLSLAILSRESSYFQNRLAIQFNVPIDQEMGA